MTLCAGYDMVPCWRLVYGIFASVLWFLIHFFFSNYDTLHYGLFLTPGKHEVDDGCVCCHSKTSTGLLRGYDRRCVEAKANRNRMSEMVAMIAVLSQIVWICLVNVVDCLVMSSLPSCHRYCGSVLLMWWIVWWCHHCHLVTDVVGLSCWDE